MTRPLSAQNAVCPICRGSNNKLWAHAKDVEYVSSEDVYTYYRCTHCDILFIKPVPLDKLKTIYPGNYYSFIPQARSITNSIKGRLDSRNFRKVLKNFNSSAINILDVGGGTGWLLDKLQILDQRVAYTQIVDLDPDAAEQAKLSGHHYFCGRIEDFETDHKFDLILMLNLIEHVADPAAVLKKVSELLTPSGRILIKTPNFDSLDANLFRNANWGGYHCPRHWVLFNQKSFENVAKQNGLSIIESHYTQGAPFWSVSVIAWLADKSLLKVSKARPAAAHPLYSVLNAFFAAFDFLRRPFAKTSQIFFILGASREI